MNSRGGVFSTFAVLLLLAFILLLAFYGGRAVLQDYGYLEGKDKGFEEIGPEGIIKEELSSAGELISAQYLYTCREDYSNSRTISGWNIPLTEKSFTVVYDGIVKAGIKDLSQTKIKKTGPDTYRITLPQVEITECYLIPDSLSVMNESHNILNQISVEDVNNAQKNLEANMLKKAEEHGLLDSARDNARMIIKGLLTGTRDLKGCTFEFEFED